MKKHPISNFNCQLLNWPGKVTEKWGGKCESRYKSGHLALLVSCVVCAPVISGVCAIPLCLSGVGFNGWQ